MKSKLARAPRTVLALAILGLAGCSGGNQLSEVKYPDAKDLPKPVIIQGGKEAKADTSTQSRGNPSDYNH